MTLHDATLTIRNAEEGDVPLILSFIKGLADYEKLSDEVEATEELLREHLFGPAAFAEVLLAEQDGEPVGFALFFQNFSTFLAKPGIFLEDLYVLPERRGRGYGVALLSHVARLAVERDCGRLEWSVLDWNEPAIRFYRSLGAVSMDEWTTNRLTGEPLRKLGGRPSS